MALKFKVRERNALRAAGVKGSHIKAWEGGVCPAHKYLPLVVEVTGKAYQEIFSLYTKKTRRKKGGSGEPMPNVG